VRWRRRGGAAGAVLVAAGTLVAACKPVPRGSDALSATAAQEQALPVFTLRWKLPVSGRSDEHKPQEFASAVAYLDRLFIGSQAGYLYGLSARDGRPLWKRKVGPVAARPVVDSGRIYLGTAEGAMMCLETLEGDARWRYGTRGPILHEPVLTGETVFFSNEADQVYALDQRTGKFRWQYKGDTPEKFTLRGHAGVAVDGELVFAGFANGTVVALRASTGSVAWMTSLTANEERFVDVDTTPVVVGELLFAASSAGGVFGIDKSTGVIRWRAPIKGAGTLTSDGSRIYVVAADEGVHALDLAGNVVWRQGTRGGGEPAQPLVTGNYLIYALSDAGVFVSDKRTGRLLQYFDPGLGVSSTPTVAPDDSVYILSNGGMLYALNLHRFD
jgi:outer membrane protein assembly factor BamB